VLVLLQVDGPPGALLQLEHRSDATVDQLVQALHAAGLVVGDPRSLAVDGRRHAGSTLLVACGLRAGAVLSPATDRTAPTGRRAPAALHVVGGLLAGTQVPLATGPQVVGRTAAVVLPDPTVSARHATLHLEAEAGDERAWVRDLGSRNGTSVDGRWATDRTEVGPGARLAFGAVVAEVRPRHPAHPPPPRHPDGRTVVNRPPRLPAHPPEPAAALPAPLPPPPPRSPFSWSAAAVPLVVGVGMATVLGPVFALFALLSPLAVVGGWVEQRVRARRHRRRAQRAVQAAAIELDGALHALAVHERRRLEAALPDLPELVRRTRSTAPTLWERRGGDRDALALRLGRGTVPWSTPIDADADPAWHARTPLVDVVERHRHLAGVPVAVHLADGDLGIVGPNALVHAVARSLVLQAVVLHGPADLTVQAHHHRWQWTHWLPHAEPAAETPWALVVHDTRVDGPPPGAPDPAAPHQQRRIVLSERRSLLPASCRTVVEVTSPDGTAEVLRTDSGACLPGVLLDGTSEAVAAESARAMAHLVDPALDADGSLPPTVALHELLELDAEAVTRAWAHPADRLPAVLGRTASGPLVIDLVADGPHALVAGTTGSGKSELLRTLVASLAAGSGPDQVALVLLDFKGGSAFDRCAELPHVTGVVTDLDGTLATRVLRGLDAELRHRERRLRAAGIDDLARWSSSAEPGETMPRLVLVVDEFAVLATEAPDVLAGLVDVAQRGRSLGIHLVLATQRPGGIVTDRIRANTSLRLALRTVDTSDSFDVIGTGDAAQLDRRTPGRVIVRAGADAPVFAQTALVTGGRAAGLDEPVHVALASLEAPAATTPLDPRPAERARATDLDAVVRATTAAARAAGIRSPRRPWTDPLPTCLRARDLDAPPSPGAGLALGLVDDVDQRRRRTWCWGPGRGHLVVHGASGSGVTTALVVAAAAAAEHAQVHVVDPAGALVHHGGAPRWASRTDPADRTAVRRLVEQLEGGHPSAPPAVVAIDRWHATAATLDDLEGARLLDALVRRLARGASGGAVGLLGLDRATGLPAALAPAASQRLVLRLSDPHEVGMVGVPLPAWARTVLVDAAPGRGVATPDGLEVQVAQP
jgi:S-DNA-T family DNA segregation ATPase FtsK/SpoIIIE